MGRTVDEGQHFVSSESKRTLCRSYIPLPSCDRVEGALTGSASSVVALRDLTAREWQRSSRAAVTVVRFPESDGKGEATGVAAENGAHGVLATTHTSVASRRIRPEVFTFDTEFEW